MKNAKQIDKRHCLTFLRRNISSVYHPKAHIKIILAQAEENKRFSFFVVMLLLSMKKSVNLSF